MNDEQLSDILGELRYIGDQLRTIADLHRQQAEADEPQLYCPPSEHCPGGIPLRISFVKGNENRDKLYHPLPKVAWYVTETETGTTNVRNHNVWRSKALRSPEEAQASEPDDAEHEPDPRTVTAKPAGEKKPPPWAEELSRAMARLKVEPDDLHRFFDEKPTNGVIVNWLNTWPDQTVTDLVEQAAAFRDLQKAEVL